MGEPMPRTGDILLYVSRGSADGVYPSTEVPFIVTKVYDLVEADYGPIEVEALDGVGVSYTFDCMVTGWTLNSHGIRFEEDVPFVRGASIPGTCHFRST